MIIDPIEYFRLTNLQSDKFYGEPGTPWPSLSHVPDLG